MEVEDGEMNQAEPGGEEEFSGVARVSWKNCKLKKIDIREQLRKRCVIMDLCEAHGKSWQ